MKPIEKWAEEKGVEAWWLAGAKHMHRWAEGKEVSESDFDEAIDAIKNLRVTDPASIHE